MPPSTNTPVLNAIQTFIRCVSAFLCLAFAASSFADTCTFYPPTNEQIKIITPYQGACKSGLANGSGKVRYEVITGNNKGKFFVAGEFLNGKIHGKSTVVSYIRTETGTFVEGFSKNTMVVFHLPNGKKHFALHNIDGKTVASCGAPNSQGLDCSPDLKTFFTSDLAFIPSAVLTDTEIAIEKPKTTDCNAIPYVRTSELPSVDFAKYAFCVKHKKTLNIDSMAIIDFKKTDGQLIGQTPPTYRLNYTVKYALADGFEKECAASATGPKGQQKSGVCFRVWIGAENFRSGDIWTGEGAIEFTKYESGWKHVDN